MNNDLTNPAQRDKIGTRQGESSDASQQRPDEVRVAIGIVHHENEFLVGIRGPAGPLAGLAEFPGGKCLPGESPERCVIREVKEETGLDVIGCRLRAEKVHKYPHSLLRLSFFDCDSAGPAEPRAPFRWVSRQDLAGLKFPEANREIIRSLVAGLD